IVREAHYQALYPYGDNRVAQSNRTTAPNRTGSLDDWAKRDPIAEVKNLLRLDLKLLVTGVPVFPETAYRNVTLEGAQSAKRIHVPDGIGSVAEQDRVKVLAISSLKQALRKLHQVGGRGLLRHRLPRQPCGFEGLSSFRVEPPTQELPVAEREQVPEPALNPHPAGLAATVVQDADEHHVTRFGELLGGVVNLLPGLCPLSHPIENLRVSPVRAARLNQARRQPKLYC